MPVLAALALMAALYHALNHAFMKSLLFLGTGAVLHATGERNLGRLGGLIHRMPWVAWLVLVGALALAGLPPLNGFVSEWLLLQAFLFAPDVPRTVRQHAVAARCAALVALAAALAGLRHGQVLRRGVPRPAARSAAGARRTMPAAGARGLRGSRCGLRAARLAAGAGPGAAASVAGSCTWARAADAARAVVDAGAAARRGRPRTLRSCFLAAIAAMSC